MKINIVGNIFGTTGYASHTRQFTNALYKYNDNIKLESQLPSDWMRQVNDAELNMIQKGYRKPDVTIGILTPPFWKLAYNSYNSKHFVGFLVWEGTRIPEYWIPYLADKKVSQIWVPSKHTRMAIYTTMNDCLNDKTKYSKEYCDLIYSIRGKIKIVPHGVDLSKFYSLNKDTNFDKRQSVFLDKKSPKNNETFKFICVKGWRGGYDDRGGVGYVLKAFKEEFNEGENVELILKTNPAYLHPNNILTEMNKLQLPNTLSKVTILAQDMDTNNLCNLYNSTNVYVCAQLADAFNIPGLEAMACGLPTIQTNFGGQVDYMNEGNSWKIPYTLKPVTSDTLYEECEWATPNVEELKKIMRYCFEHRNEVKLKGIQSLTDVKDWTWNNTAKKALEILKKIK